MLTKTIHCICLYYKNRLEEILIRKILGPTTQECHISATDTEYFVLEFNDLEQPVVS